MNQKDLARQLNTEKKSKIKRSHNMQHLILSERTQAVETEHFDKLKVRVGGLFKRAGRKRRARISTGTRKGAKAFVKIQKVYGEE